MFAIVIMLFERNAQIELALYVPLRLPMNSKGGFIKEEEYY